MSLFNPQPLFVFDKILCCCHLVSLFFTHLVSLPEQKNSVTELATAPLCRQDHLKKKNFHLLSRITVQFWQINCSSQYHLRNDFSLRITFNNRKIILQTFVLKIINCFKRFLKDFFCWQYHLEFINNPHWRSYQWSWCSW